MQKGGLLVPASYQTFGTAVDPTTNQPTNPGWGINGETSHHAWETIIGTARITTFGDIINYQPCGQ